MNSIKSKIGHLQILEEGPDKKLKCECDCGEIVFRSRSLLYNGTENSSCGCQKGSAIALGRSRKDKTFGFSK